MKLRKNIVSLLTVALLGLTPVVATVPAYAASSTTNQPNFLTSLVQAISQKFGIDEGQLQSFVSTFAQQHHEQMQQKMQANEKNHLDALVKDGKITATQEQQILDEQAKLQSEFDPTAFKNLTPDQRKAQFQKEQAEIQAWSQSTGIDAKYLRPGFGMRMHMFNHWNNNVSEIPTPGA